MARPLRIEFAGALYHVTARGNERRAIFFSDADRRAFLDIFGKVCERFNWLCHGYCQMDNHYHLLVETLDGNLSQGMRQLNGVYTQYINRTHKRVGHLFQGRFKSILVQKEAYLLELARYIVLNPVRAGRVSEAVEWRWSSYRATVGQAPAPVWLAVDGLLGQFEGDEQTARTAYQRFVSADAAAKSPWPALRGQMWLGSEAFRERMQGLIEDKPQIGVPKQQAQPTRPTAEQIIDAVAQTYGIRTTKVLDRSCQAAFRAAVYLLRCAVNLSLREVSTRAGVSIPRVSQIQRKIEARLDNDQLNALMEKYQVKN